MIVKKFSPSSPRAYRSLTRTYILPCEPLVARVAVWTRGCAYATIMLPDEAGEPTDTRLDERGAFLSSDATPAARGDLLMLITGKWKPRRGRGWRPDSKHSSGHAGVQAAAAAGT